MKFQADPFYSHDKQARIWAAADSAYTDVTLWLDTDDVDPDVVNEDLLQRIVDALNRTFDR